MLASILSAPGVEYPDAVDSFSPSERHPEYPFGHLSERPNPVYEQLREVFLQADLDAEHRGTSSWNPLGRFVAPGSRVFVLCNFVYNRRIQESSSAFAAKCIHASVLRALCDYLLIAAGPTGTIRFGNSPLQSCDWESVQSETGAAAMLDFYSKQGVRVSARDLRLFVTRRNAFGRVTDEETRDGSRDAVEVALGEESLLHDIAWCDGRPSRFRIADYRPERIEAFHSGDRHRYVVHRDVLDADVVVSLSKLKTHEKVGITCGLKGFVGMVGHKDCLAHHRFGPPAVGGDEYPDAQGILRPVSAYQDWVQSRPRSAALQAPLQVLDRTARRVLLRMGADMGGAWHGNDTCWRMALDLSRVAHYADTEGVMHAVPRRRHLSLIDGIVAGEGDGPLAPVPVRAGALVFCDGLAWGDRIASRLMGFDPEAIPLVREAFREMPYPLVDSGDGEPRVSYDGRSVRVDELQPVLGRPFRAPRGWRRHLASPAP